MAELSPPTRRGRGRPPRSSAQRAEVRAELTARALEAIRVVGPDISIEQLAAQLGVGRSILYDHFENKMGLADAIALDFVARFESRRTGAAQKRAVQDPASDLIESAVRFLVELIEKEPAFYGFSVRAIQASGRSFLDNGLVRALHTRTDLLAPLLAPDATPESARVLLDGTFGFLFAAIESWQQHGKPQRDTLITDLTTAILRLATR